MEETKAAGGDKGVVVDDDAFGVGAAKDVAASCEDMRHRLEMQACDAHRDAEVASWHLAASLPDVDPSASPEHEENDLLTLETLVTSAVAAAEDGTLSAARAAQAHAAAKARADAAAAESKALAGALRFVQAEKRELKALSQRIPKDAKDAEGMQNLQRFEDVVARIAGAAKAGRGKGAAAGGGSSSASSVGGGGISNKKKGLL